MAVSRDEVRHIAELAALPLDDDEADRLARELSTILDHVDALRDADTGDVAEGSAGDRAPIDEEGRAPIGKEGRAPVGDGGRAPLRADRPDADRLAHGPGAMAPEWADGFFTVPRLASHGGEGAGEAAGQEPDASAEPAGDEGSDGSPGADERGG